MKLHFDLHTHSRFSADGVAQPEAMIAEAKKRGLAGFAITDHNTCACVDYFIQKGLLREDGEPVGKFLIIPGQEISTSEGHLLALGIRLPDLKGISPAEAVDIIHQNGGLAIPAHPYDFFRAGIKEHIIDSLDVDAIEVFNAATTLRHCNRMALQYAKQKGIPMTAGSDAHHERAIGTAYTILEPEQFNLAGILESIKHASNVKQQYLSTRQAIRKTFNNVFRFKIRRRRKRK